ncbi:hypothetical protein RUM43_003176 [Polyplax serrata]|uniref:Diphosphomevalonate decarboxylase n=1 Tax=Polyplax serrata TaxID=468196 RepID=A0AAN8NZR0_POLSC
MEIVTCVAPVNIAAIKYWGKRDEDLILPLNDSISLTINTKFMRAKTTIAASPKFEKDKIWLNGREESILNPRLEACLKEIRMRAEKSSNPQAKAMKSWKVHICSENNFPTAAGLASSSAGYACLVYTLARLFRLEGEDLSVIARRGSGSACRSIHGGFVIWNKGINNDGSDSFAEQIAPASHWKDMRILILVVNSDRKSVGSSKAMQRSVKTSDFLKNFKIDERVAALRDSILKKDFERFAELTMRDSNRLHSVCLDTYPPVQYLTDTSHFIMQLVHHINDFFGKAKVAYTFDAGPNACLFLLEDTVKMVLSLINYFLPPNLEKGDESYMKGEKIQPEEAPKTLLESIPLRPRAAGSLESIIYVDVGGGPEVLPEGEHLLNDIGFPLSIS